MRRVYSTRRAEYFDVEPDGENYLARTVYEQFEDRDTGLLDTNGNYITVSVRMGPIGFVHFS